MTTMAEAIRGCIEETDEKVSFNQIKQAIKDRYPGIATKHTTAVIMSRSTQQSFASYEDMDSYIELMLETSKVDEIWTYDQLLERAKEVHNKLASLGVSEHVSK